MFGFSGDQALNHSVYPWNWRCEERLVVPTYRLLAYRA
jgi:hypothetical protein